MINRLIKSKTGVTVLEGLIALGILAMVAAATFGVLLSISRKSSQPDIREEMILAVERAQASLQLYNGLTPTEISNLPAGLQDGLCGSASVGHNPLNVEENGVAQQEATYDIHCMLPAICETGAFTYTIETAQNVNRGGIPFDYSKYGDHLPQERQVTFQISCNGQTL